MTLPFPEPTSSVPSRAEVLLGYLDYFRAVVLDKLDGLDDHEVRRSRLPSGWSPLSLLKHLILVERRWLAWGFAGEDVGDPWADTRDDRWFVSEDETKDGLARELRAQAEVTREIVGRHALDDRGAPGPRWDGAAPATLERVLLHLLQEYARHAGHLDVVRELIDGRVGE